MATIVFCKFVVIHCSLSTLKCPVIALITPSTTGNVFELIGSILNRELHILPVCKCGTTQYYDTMLSLYKINNLLFGFNCDFKFQIFINGNPQKEKKIKLFTLKNTNTHILVSQHDYMRLFGVKLLNLCKSAKIWINVFFLFFFDASLLNVHHNNTIIKTPLYEYMKQWVYYGTTFYFLIDR